MDSKQPDHYEVLGLPRDATPEEIKHAYYQAAQKLHPDVNTAPGETEMFLDVQRAYEVLSHPERRAQYDATLPPQEEPGSLVLYEVYFSRPNLVKLDEPQMIYLLLQVSPRSAVEQDITPPLNVSLVLDRSTSMQGEKLDTVKAAAIRLLRGLKKDDLLSVVSFSDRADVIVPAGFRSDDRDIEARIHRMQPSGATELFQGLATGLEEVQRNLDPRRVNHVILLTDGHTYGDERACLELAEQAAARNIGITGMGIGADWNDIFLDALSSRTGGSSAYIATAQSIEQVLAEKFKMLANTFANEVTLELTAQEGVDLSDVFRIEPESGPVTRESPMHLGPILQDTPLSVLFEFIVHPSALLGNSVTLLNGSLRISIAARPQPVPPIHLRLAREVEADATDEPPPAIILRALSRLTLYRLQEKAHLEADAGRIDAATRSLRNLASHLLSQGQRGLARTALLEADNIERSHAWSAQGGKEIKYGTRALLALDAREKER